MGGKNKSVREDLRARGLVVGLVTESNSSILVSGDITSNHGGQEEAVAVGRVQGGNLALSRSTKGEDGGGSQEGGGSGWTHVFESVCVLFVFGGLDVSCLVCGEQKRRVGQECRGQWWGVTIEKGD